MRIDVLYYMEIKNMVKKDCKASERGGGGQPWAAGGTYTR